MQCEFNGNFQIVNVCETVVLIAYALQQRNGADFSVFLNTASEFDGSDSGARPDEAVSWGKIRKDASAVKIYAEASLILPLLVAQTFAKRQQINKTAQ